MTKMDEFENRCEKAIEELRKLKLSAEQRDNAFEETRLSGKIEGVQLSLSYYREEKVLLEHAFDKKREQLYDNLRKAVVKNSSVIKNEGYQDDEGIK